MNTTTNVNLFLLRAIPLDKNLKRYYLGKYHYMCKHNGVDYANAKFKQLNSALKHYKATGDIPSLGLRRNGWMKKLINYVDSQPHFVFNFLKGLTSWKSSIDVDSVSSDFDSKLKSIESNYPTPRFMMKWINLLDLSRRKRSTHYFIARKNKEDVFHRYCKCHSESEWHKYWRRWSRVLKANRQPSSANRDRPMFPEMYKDFSDGSSRSHERDIVNLLTILQTNMDLSKVSKDLLIDYLSDDLQDQYYAMMMEEWYPDYSCTDFMSGEYVGDVHYIPKSGTDYRPIAVPNRLIQSALVPIYEILKSHVAQLDHDCTFDQDKFDSWIQSRVTTDSRFIGSVDLSSATENLPLEWIQPFFRRLHLNEEQSASLVLFNEISRARWNNDGYMSKWKVGQPLGSLPSFMTMALTHNLFCESLSLKEGYDHSPYRILGDDIVIASKRLYRAYIRELDNRKIPLSLSKSYAGKLTEFAGKIYVKKNKPFLTPDHNPITWQSLFDWQYSTGIRLPWSCLPKNIRNRITRRAKGYKLSGQRLYQWAQHCCVYDRGSSYTSLPSGTTLEEYFSIGTDEPVPTYSEHTGMTQFQNKILIVQDNKRPVGNGMFRRFIQTSLPKWFRSKYRPTVTDKVISNTITALRESEVI